VVIEMDKISNEMLNVLVAYKVPVEALDRVLAYLKDLAYTNTPIQNIDLGGQASESQEVVLRLDDEKLARGAIDKISGAVSKAVINAMNLPNHDIPLR
jgi:hypothetical protein